MPTTATPARRARRTPAAHKQPSSLDYLQKAVVALDEARGRASEELRTYVESAIGRLSAEIRKRKAQLT